MIDEDLLNKVASHIEILHRKNEKEGVYFHNFRNTSSKVGIVTELARKYQISNYYQKLLLFATWFKDTGILVDHKKPAKESVSMAETFLTENGVDEDLIKKVTSLIWASYNPRPNPSLLEKIIHDADVAYIGKKNFFMNSEILRMEYESLMDKFINDYEWEKHQYKVLSETSFQTEAAFKKYEKVRINNLKKQWDRMNKARSKTKRRETEVKSGRSLDSFYRDNYRNHINLTSIVDRKTSVMISLNTIIIVVIVIFAGIGFSISSKFNHQNFRFLAPIITLLLSSFISVIFAILSARPKIIGNRMQDNKIKENKTSPLFFGNFINISLHDFVMHMRELKYDPQWLYDSMSADIYFFGKTLNEKYRLLHWSYTIFMIGLIVSTILFIFIFSYTIA